MEKSAEAFRTISEVAEILETPAHVLRFWESRFPQIRPVKRAGGRRYYRPADVALLAGIRRLLHDEGMTIRGVQKILREQGVRHVAALSGGDPLPLGQPAPVSLGHEDDGDDEPAGFIFEEVPETRGEIVPFARAPQKPPRARPEPATDATATPAPEAPAPQADVPAPAPVDLSPADQARQAALAGAAAAEPLEPAAAGALEAATPETDLSWAAADSDAAVPEAAAATPPAAGAEPDPPASGWSAPPPLAGRRRAPSGPPAPPAPPESGPAPEDEPVWRPALLRALAAGAFAGHEAEARALAERLRALRDRLDQASQA